MSRYFAFVSSVDRVKAKAIKSVNSYLSKKGHSVAIIKRIKDLKVFKNQITREDIEFDELPSELVYISPDGSKVTLIGDNHDPRIFQWIEYTADYILLDGFDTLPDIPKVIILDANEPSKYKDEETVAVIGTHEKTRMHPLYKTITELPELVETLALPPNRELNCGKCGYPNCKAFRAMVLKGKANVSDCVTYKSPVQIYVNEAQIALVPFTQRLIESVITEMVRSLHLPDEGIKTIRVVIKKQNKDGK